MADSASKSLGQYALSDKIGLGRNGTVMRAWDNNQRRWVAIKMIREEIAADFKFVKQFHARANAIAAIDHPGLITISDIGEQDGQHFIVSEYVDGETLDKLAIEEPLGTARFFTLSLKIIEALAFAHEKMIVHGNLKPSNIIVTKDDEIRILDFGLNPRGEQVVKRIEADSIRYMAPEQIEGHDPNFASDLYALGGIFHCMLTGDAPFVSPITEELMTVIRHQPIDAAQMIEEGISSELILVVKRLLSKSPVDRFVNIAELKTTMEAIYELSQEGHPLDRIETDKSSPNQYVMISIIVALLIVIWSVVVSIMK